MASKSQAKTESPSSSTYFLPLRMQSRRGSNGSLPPASKLDKESLNHALDRIHSVASQSAALTTFNDFAPPPSSSSGAEPKGITSELQGGISGLYNRFRASVGGVKDLANVSIASSEDRGGLVDDSSSVKSVSQKSGGLPSPSANKLTFKSPKYESPTASISSLKQVGIQRASSGQAESLNHSLKLEAKRNVGSRHSTKLSLSEVLAADDSDVAASSHQLVNDGSEDFQRQQMISPRTAIPSVSDDVSGKKDPVTIDLNDKYPSILQSQTREKETGLYALQGARSPTNSSETRQPAKERASISSLNADHRIPANELIQSAQPIASGQGKVPLAAPSQQLEKGPLPAQMSGINFSRASSYETGGASSINTALDVKSSSEGYQENDKQPAIARTAPKSIATVQASADHRAVNGVLSQTRTRVLSKEYWMRDENARDCFHCGDAFSTFRRKHHCRTCGQIFDAKCTSLIPGKPFGQSSLLRVCKPCEGIINGYDDSSEYSEDGSVSGMGHRPRHGSAGASDSVPAVSLVPPRMSDISEMEAHSPSASDSVPTMAIPATRRLGDELNRRSAILEINPELRLPRPSSSRSLKGSSRLTTSAHRRHHSKYQLNRGLRAGNEEVAPFHRRYDDDSKSSGRLPAFHSDNIIDPDLAAFLSDEDSSGDEQLSIAAAMSGDNLVRGLELDRSSISGLLPSSKKARSRLGEKSISGVTFASRDADNVSISSGKMGHQAKGPKRRNLSLTSNVHLRPSPRAHRMSTASPAVGTGLHESMMSTIFDPGDQHGVKTIRSSSLKGAAAPPVELNNASIQHVRKLLRQLLQDAEVSHVGQWERALVPTLLQATDDVDPNIQHGDDIDIRHYVKLKKVPGGKPGDTGYVSGLVFTKNLALKSMPRTILNPNILIVTFPIEYARHHQHFMSLEPVIRQEREFLQNLVHRIAALRPQLLLVERGVSGLALEFLKAAGIATAYNVKASVLEAVSRCSQTRIVSSIDKLAIMPVQASRCASFSLKTFFFNGRKKTYMYFAGCPKELGCTLVLRGGDETTLAKIKRITEFMVYVVYNLKLETSLMRDEFALIPSYVTTGSLSPDKSMSKKPFTMNDAAKDFKTSSSTSPLPLATPKELASTKHALTPQLQKMDSSISDDAEVPADIPMPTFYGDMVEKHKVKILSASPFVKFMQPHLLMRAREQERRLAYLKRLQDQDELEYQRKDDETKPQRFVLIKPEMIHESIRGTSRKVREVLRAVHDAEFDKALHIYQTQKKQWETYIAGNINLFDPFAHQNIAVLYSVVCTVTTVPCSGPDMLALGFYNEHETESDFEADCTLGQYVEDLCLGANKVCTANGCERKMYEHHRQYVHGEAQLSVFVEQYPCKMRGLQEVILMWSVCRLCGNETQVLPMSDNSWKYSFGKYLELSFWSSELHARAGICPHDIHRNHIRYFGFKDMALRIQYDPISLLEIIVPRTRITWKVANDLRFKNDVFSKVEERLNRFMASVKSRIKSIRVETVLPEKGELCKEETEKMMKRVCDEHVALLRNLQDKYMNSKYYEITPFNSALRAIQEKVVEWDGTFADFDKNFFLPEKDIRRLAALQLKKIFLDRDDPAASLTSSTEGLPPVADIELTEKFSTEETEETVSHTAHLSPERAHDMLSSVVRENSVSSGDREEHEHSPATSSPVPTNDLGEVSSMFNHQDIRHLDLATSSDFPEKIVNANPQMNSDGRCVSPPALGNDKQDDLNSPGTPLAKQLVLDRSTEKSLVASKPSQIPQVKALRRPLDASFRKGSSTAPILNRTQSQPVATIRRDNSVSSGNSSRRAAQGLVMHPQDGRSNESRNSETVAHPHEKISDRLLGRNKKLGMSMIPRSVASRRKESRVSALAKHFEQLSREFEKERLKERRQHAAKYRQARGYPMASSKPIVEIFQNAHEAAEERNPSDEDSPEQDSLDGLEESTPTSHAHAHATLSQTPGDSFHAEETAAEETAEETAENTETDDNTHLDSHTGSDLDNQSDDDPLADGIPDVLEKDLSSPNDSQLDLKLDLPKHEKTSLMKMLTNFWAERSASGWQALEYPLSSSDHVFADSDIIVREDEPSSLIAFALGSEDYQSKLKSIQEKSSRLRGRPKTINVDGLPPGCDDGAVEKLLLRSTGTHLSYQFREGSARMQCKIFYAEQFDAVRRKCGVSERIVESLSRCLKWDSKGGKTKSVFLKTLDDRLVLKSLSKIETQAFLKFAPAYFRIISETLFHDLPSVIAKMLGFYQIVIKNPASGVEFDWYVLVMENLFYDRAPTRIFDLKGSMRNRRIQSTGEQNEVLLDENMVEFIYESPLFAREHSKKLLRASVHNDTLFLSQQNVMDYSLMIAVDETRRELVVGIIDCIRTYTWDKKLESWMKSGKNRPTVTSPREYKRRFREAMSRYVLQAPNCWHQYQAQHADPGALRFVGRVSEDGPQTLDGEGGEVEHTVVL